MQSLNSLSIVSLLHKNTVHYLGIKERNSYLATRTLNNKFIALDTTNEIQTWDIITGKRLHSSQIN